MARDLGFENHRLRTLIWIVRRLQRRPMSLSELNDEWQDDVDISGGREIERRTFSNHLRAIQDLFGIIIECNRRNGYKYKIVSTEVAPVVSLMMDNFEQTLALGNAQRLEGRILVDKAPCGAEYLEKIMEAMEESRCISFEFMDFNIPEPFTVTGAPYCLKLYQQRWYVVMREEDGYTDTYSLDRITYLKKEDATFLLDPDFDAEEYFRQSFGVRVQQGEEPSVIKLKVHAVQRGYIRTLPLHPSQQEIETTEGYSIFTIEVVPTVELTMKLLSYGFLVEVLEPASLREVMMDEVEGLYNMYFF